MSAASVLYCFVLWYSLVLYTKERLFRVSSGLSIILTSSTDGAQLKKLSLSLPYLPEPTATTT